MNDSRVCVNHTAGVTRMNNPRFISGEKYKTGPCTFEATGRRKSIPKRGAPLSCFNETLLQQVAIHFSLFGFGYDIKRQQRSFFAVSREFPNSYFELVGTRELFYQHKRSTLRAPGGARINKHRRTVCKLITIVYTCQPSEGATGIVFNFSNECHSKDSNDHDHCFPAFFNNSFAHAASSALSGGSAG